MVVAGGSYYAFTRSLDLPSERIAIRASEKVLHDTGVVR